MIVKKHMNMEAEKVEYTLSNQMKIQLLMCTVTWRQTVVAGLSSSEGKMDQRTFTETGWTMLEGLEISLMSSGLG